MEDIRFWSERMLFLGLENLDKKGTRMSYSHEHYNDAVIVRNVTTREKIASVQTSLF